MARRPSCEATNRLNGYGARRWGMAPRFLQLDQHHAPVAIGRRAEAERLLVKVADNLEGYGPEVRVLRQLFGFYKAGGGYAAAPYLRRLADLN